MAVYKLFPQKDASIYSQYPSMNTGRDEILESSLEVNNLPNPEPQTSRYLIKFLNSEIQDVIENKISGSTWDAYLKVFAANIEGLRAPTTLDILCTSGSWEMGTGKYKDSPETTDGVSWAWRDTSGSNEWSTSGFLSGVTASYSSSTLPGGGTWFLSPSSSQSFEHYTNEDICANVTPLVDTWYTSSTNPQGYLPFDLSAYNFGVVNYNFTTTISQMFFPEISSGDRTSSYDVGTSRYTFDSTPSGSLTIEANTRNFFNGTIGYIVLYISSSYRGYIAFNEVTNWSDNADISVSYTGSFTAGETIEIDYVNSTNTGTFNTLGNTFTIQDSIESGSLLNPTNEGFLIKQRDEFEYDENIQPKMKYFSRDTHTIYPPQLEFRWRDYEFNTGSSTSTILDSLPAVVTVTENPGIFYPNSIHRFRVNSRPEFPARLYQTGSIYTTNYYLPTASYYAVQDMNTNEYIIDFDDQYTQISADSTNNYFDIYMSGLEPERYYKILIKTTINNSTIIFDDNFYFKVVNGE